MTDDPNEVDVDLLISAPMEACTGALRFYNGVLQQEYLIIGQPGEHISEWRDVPVIDEPEVEV